MFQYIVPTLNKELELGVYNKIQYQIKSVEYLGLSTKLSKAEKASYFQRLLPFGYTRWKFNNINIDPSVEILYVRHTTADFMFLLWLKKCKKKYPYIHIVLEMPSYPYDKEVKSTNPLLFYYRDLIYRRFLCKYVDLVVVYTDFLSVFGIPAIKIFNPIDVEAVPIHNGNKIIKNEINLVIVAQLAYWHGCDRIIEGIREYNKTSKKYKIVFHIIGQGKIVRELKEKTLYYNLSENVKFYGPLSGDQLDEVFRIADIGVDALGAHRKDDKWFGSIKSIEYVARGVPFISEYIIPEELSELKNYIFQVPFDDSSININELIEFYLKLKYSCSDISQKMRTIAIQKFDYKLTMKPVLNYFKLQGTNITDNCINNN